MSWTPIWAMCEPSGPIENGTTYIVRPRIDPLNSSSRISRISAGSRQLLVGPASSSRSEQMKVRSSTRATSSGSERARYEFGRLASESFSKVPASTSSWQRRSYSSAEPSHQWIAPGSVRSANCSTQAISFVVLGQLLRRWRRALGQGLGLNSSSSVSLNRQTSGRAPGRGQPLLRTPRRTGGVSCSRSWLKASSCPLAVGRPGKLDFPPPHALLRVRVTEDRRAGRDPGHRATGSHHGRARPARPPSEIGGPVVIKSQVLTGGRMKAGGVKFADTPRGGRGARRRDPRARDRRPHAASACSSIQRRRSPRSTTRRWSGTGRGSGR